MAFTPPTTYASKANTGYLSTFGVGSPPTAVIEVVSFTMPLANVPAIPKTHLQSPSNTEEMQPGMIKPGVFDISGSFIGDPTQTGILTDMQNSSLLPFTILSSMQENVKTLTATGTGFFTDLEFGPFENNKNIEFKAKFQTTGTTVVNVA